MSLAEREGAQLLKAARQQHQAGGGYVLDILLRGGVEFDALKQWLRQYGGVGLYAVEDGAQLRTERWPADLARQSKAALVALPDGRQMAVAADPWDQALLQHMARATGQYPEALLISEPDLSALLGVEAAMDPESPQGQGPAIRAEGPIVDFVDQALRAGFDGGASDVHFECDREGVSVKHRIDGVMVNFARMGGALPAQQAISRIKVLALLDITERRLPQDGRFRFELGPKRSVDLRVSIMPSVHGEDAVLRLLDKAQLRGGGSTVSLSQLGFTAADADMLREWAQSPSGMLLVTGPTGSGKTTTVYAMLSEINTGQEKIITIEDPVEYELQGVLQIPVNERKGLTFAKGLRSILRHDPDRILVGEIRDAETAEIAVQSALTGHLVFTTVHANSIADVVGRFRHFGLDMFGLMSSLNGLVVQRLLRKLCPHCCRWQACSAADLKAMAQLSWPAVEEMPVAVGCELCHHTGYKGRFVVAELHEIDDELRDLITEGAPLSAIKAQRVRRGVSNLHTQSLDHVRAGRTTVEEVRRVIGRAC